MRSDLTAHDIANDIRMTRGQYSGSFVIVEGEISDLKFYSNLIDRDECQIVPAHHKDNALGALEMLEGDEVSGVIAIVDANFMDFKGGSRASPNLFVTDTHDLETMILDSPALEKILIEFGSAKKIDRFIQETGKEIRQALLDVGRQAGYLRLVSIEQELSLTFEEIDFGRFVDRKTLSLDLTKLVKTVKNKSGRHDLDEDYLLRAIEEVSDDKHDPWKVCSGHDLVEVLSLGLRGTLGSNKALHVERKVLEKSLRLSYESSYFSTTQLYASLKTWEANNRPFQILREDI